MQTLIQPETQTSQYTVRRYTPEDAAQWDDYLSRCPMGTFLHSRRFLGYHGDRFLDLSLMVFNAKGKLVALLPAAEAPGDNTKVVSHPGITYGGLLHNGDLFGTANIEAFQAIQAFYSAMGYETLLYKAIPYVYHQRPSSDDLYSLFRLNAKRIRCDLSSTIDLEKCGTLSHGRKSKFKRAMNSGIEIVPGIEYAPAIWDILQSRLQNKHGAKPVHSVEEIMRLGELFPEQIQFIAAKQDDVVLAGAVYFVMPTNIHLQYSASSDIGYKLCTIDALFQYSITRARYLGCRYVDFGNSNEDGGWFLNDGLYQFKSEFGASGTVHEFYELTLRQ